MSTYTISTALVTIPKLSAQISVLLRGETGIGKSYIVKGLGKSLGMKVIDRRLSQMTEGDLLGLPSIVDGTTQWNPPDWFHEACEHGVILFLDEMNRATREVQQGAFQEVALGHLAEAPIDDLHAQDLAEPLDDVRLADAGLPAEQHADLRRQLRNGHEGRGDGVRGHVSPVSSQGSGAIIPARYALDSTTIAVTLHS
jgi:midasin (ATPase involved in ribosome maturation)